MPKLIVTRGLPGSGKSTKAQAWVAEDPSHRARVNRDGLRLVLHDGVWRATDTERQIMAVRDAAIRTLLRKGVNVINDDTNLKLRTVRDLRRIATLAGADFEVWDLTDVSLAMCITRDGGRHEFSVGDAVITGMWQRFIKGQPYPLLLPDEMDEPEGPGEPYVRPLGAEVAIIVDIDGTVALMGARDPFDESRVHEDQPNWQVIKAVEAMWLCGHDVIFCSGRTDACRDATLRWLKDNVRVPIEELYMRAVGDTRKDAVVKRETFDRHIRHNYNVTAVFDDRNQVVDMWRSLGLTVFQVAEGNF